MIYNIIKMPKGKKENKTKENISDSEEEVVAPKKEKVKKMETKENTSDSEEEVTPKKETDNESVEKSEPEEDTSQLKMKVESYLKIDDEIRGKREEIKELQEKKVIYEEYIMNYLEKANKTKIETNDGDIVFKKQTSKMPLKEELFEKAIVKKFQDMKKITESGAQIAHDILEEVGKLRGVNIKNNIRRVKKGNGKKK
jgi:hypothetical protein